MPALFKIFGCLWLIGGAVGSVGLLAQLWLISRDPALPSVAFIGTLPFLALSGAAVANGVGLVTRKQWSEIVTIILSPILLLYSLASIVLIGSQFGIMVVLFLIALSGLWVMLSNRGKRAFDVYVS